MSVMTFAEAAAWCNLNNADVLTGDNGVTVTVTAPTERGTWKYTTTKPTLERACTHLAERIAAMTERATTELAKQAIRADNEVNGVKG